MTLDMDNKETYSSSLNKLRTDVKQDISKFDLDIDNEADAEYLFKYLSQRVDKNKIFWKVMASGNEGATTNQIGSIAFRDTTSDATNNRIMSKKITIHIMEDKAPLELRTAPENETEAERETRESELSKWESGNIFRYIITTSSIPKNELIKFLKPSNLTSEEGEGYKAIGNSNGYTSLSEALRILWIWLLTTSLGTSFEFLQELVKDSSKYEALQIENGYTISDFKKFVKNPILGVTGDIVDYRTKITTECNILKQVYGILGLKIDVQTQKSTEFINQENTDTSMVQYLSVSTDFHSVSNSFLDIVTNAIYGKKSCTYTNAKWIKQLYKQEETEVYDPNTGKKVNKVLSGGLLKPSGTEEVKGILINLISPVQDEIGFKSPNVLNKSNTEFEFNLKTTSRVDAIKQILNTILAVFSKTDKLIVDGSETEDQTKLIELVKEFTSILLAHVTSIKTVADYQPIYTCMYNYLVPKWPAKTNLLIDNTSLQVRDNILYTTIPNNNKVLFSKFENETRKEVPKTDTGTIDTSTTGQSALSQGVKKKRMGF